MELTKRDAAAALAALGAGGAAAGATAWERLGGTGADVSGGTNGSDDNPDPERIRETLVAVAAVVYPSTVSGIEAFVETFLSGRLDREDHAAGMAATVAELNELATEWYGEPVSALEPSTCDELLRDIGADTAEEHPDGTTAERVRYYVVNELLLALYRSPKGGELVGLENPQGHPGGTDTYQQGPQP